MKDFFISHSGEDTDWAEWIAWVLEEAGYAVTVDVWDFRPGSNFVLEMDEAAEADRTIAVLTQSYIDGLYTKAEWAAAFADDPKGDKGKLVPVRVEECDLKGLLKQIVYIDLVGLDEVTARRTLLEGVKEGRAKPPVKPDFPPAQRAVPARPHFPGSRTLPPHWQVPHRRNLNFTGRSDLLARIRAEVRKGQRAALTQHQAITGLGGIGKSQLALEYAYRHCGDYQIVWWVRSEEPAQLSGDFCRLAQSLDLPEKDQADQRIVTQAVRRWLESNGGWLLVFDNVPDRTALKDCLPQGGDGHVLITSRDQRWRGVAQPLPVPVWPRDESIEFLRTRTGREDEEDKALGELAEELGDLPLALEQAAAYMEGAGISVKDYLDLFRTRRSELWEEESPPDEYPETVGTTWSMAFEASREEEPAAADLLNFLAFLAPDDIPRDLLAKAIEDPLLLNRSIAALRHYSLTTAEGDALSIHRLVQAVTRDRLSEEEKKEWAAGAVRLLDAAFPFHPDDPATWEESGRLLPHALAAAGHAATIGAQLRAAGNVLNSAAMYLRVRAEFAAAKGVYERNLAITETAYGADHPNMAAAINNLGRVLHDMGDLEGAREHIERALAIAEKTFGADHPTVALRLNNLGSVLQDMGDLEGAKEHFEQALAIDEKTYGPDHPEVATDVNNLGSVLREMGDLKGAKKHYGRALAICERAYGNEHPQVATAASNLGGVLFAAGDIPGALEYAKRTLQIREKVYGPEHPDVAQSVSNIGDVLARMGKKDQARVHYERALAICRQFLGEDHPHTQLVRAKLEELDEGEGS